MPADDGRSVALTPPSGVLFDAGGTLVQVHTRRLAAALRARGHEPVDLDDAFWRTLVLLDSDFSPAAGPWDTWFHRWLARLGEHSGVPGPVMAEAWYSADAHQHLWDLPLPGAAESLARLGEAGVRVGVVSNADGRIAGALERAGLADAVEVIVDSGLVGVAKPDPTIFGHALDVLDLDAAEVWYVGDTVAYDAAGADAAGLTSWVVDHAGLHTVEHPRRVRSLAALVDAVLGR